MSDSSIALNPVIDDPSNPIPSSRAPASSDGVIAKLFRCPSMSVNQKRAYSTPSFSICCSAFLRAAGSDVARSLLSIMPMSSLAPFRPGIAADFLSASERQRSTKLDDRMPIGVAERAVELLHRLVSGLRPGVDLGQPAFRRTAQRVLLQRSSD